MLRRSPLWLLAAAAAAVAAFSFFPQYRLVSPMDQAALPQAAAYLIVFGAGDKQPAAWDGSIRLSGGQILNIQGWRFSGRDSTDQRWNWKLSTRYGPATGGGAPGPLLENGILVTAALADPSARFTVDTVQGSFSFAAQKISYASLKPFLNKRVLVEQIQPTFQLTSSEEEQDHPALAQSGDDVWLSYVGFVHGNRAQAVTGFASEPENFDFLARPAGGDQVFLMHYSKSKRTWSQPLPVSAPKQDVMRTAVAVDAQQRVWVLWSANQDGNFDIYARSYSQGKWSATQRLRSPGSKGRSAISRSSPPERGLECSRAKMIFRSFPRLCRR